MLAGWGLTPSSAAAEVCSPDSPVGLAASLADPPARGVVARGLGRSYGDAALNAGGRVVDTTGVTGAVVYPPDPQAPGALAVVRAAAGTSLDALMRYLVPRGLFVPVTPGTRFVTVGGAVAADVHGKNHHRVGSWCSSVRSMRLALPSGEVVEVSPSRDPELFWATAGGMGLTGVVVDATFTCPPIESSRLVVDTLRAPDVDAAMAAMVADDDRYDFSVAWIDLLAGGGRAGGRRLGRSVLTRGRFARAAELAGAAASAPLAFDPRVRLAAPPWVPSWVLSRASVRAFNEAWFRRAPRRRVGELQTIGQFFHPLDGVAGWNRLYGRRGFVQWQVVVPDGAEAVLRGLVGALAAAGCGSFLAVLKRFGPGNAGPLSFPMAGWTLAVDIPASRREVGALLDGLDRRVVDAGGRVYLAKDALVDPGLVAAMYPRLDEWRAVRRRVDPSGVLASDLGRRLGLCGPPGRAGWRGG